VTQGRTYTIREAGDVTGVGERAIRRRVERKTLAVHGMENRGGKNVQVIHADELARVGLLGEGAPEPPPPESRAPSGTPPTMVDARYLVDQLREVSGELATTRLLEAQAGERERREREAREALEGEVHRARAREAEAAARLEAEEERRRQAEAREASVREELETLRRAQSDREDPVDEGPAGELEDAEVGAENGHRQSWWSKVWRGEG
jgi:hypothetical protein